MISNRDPTAGEMMVPRAVLRAVLGAVVDFIVYGVVRFLYWGIRSLLKFMMN